MFIVIIIAFVFENIDMFSKLVRSSGLLATNSATELSLIRPRQQQRSFHLKTSRRTRTAADESTAKPPESTSQNVVAAKSSKSRFVLYTLTGLVGASGAYYSLALDSKEQRRVRVLLGSFVRAIRSFRTGVAIGVDYKWSLWGLEEVNSQNFNQLILDFELYIIIELNY